MNKNSQSSCCNNLYPGYEGCPNEIMSTKHRILCTKYHQTGIRGSKAFKHSQSVSCEDNNTCRAYWHHRTPVIHYRTPRSSNPSLKWVTDYEYYAGYYYCVTGEIDCRHCASVYYAGIPGRMYILGFLPPRPLGMLSWADWENYGKINKPTWAVGRICKLLFKFQSRL